MPDKNEDIRIGVFLCHCGSNIAGYLNMEELEEFSKKLPRVTFVQRNLYTCSEGGINEIKKGEFPPKTGPLCNYCDVKEICEFRAN